MIRRQRHHSLFPALVLIVVGAISVGAASAVPEEMPSDSFTETVEVELVNVEVRVLDKQGIPVEGLAAGDFQVFHDGQAVAVSNFTEFRDGIAVGADQVGVPMRPGHGIAANHHLIVYFDGLHLQAKHRDVLIEALEDFISSKQIPAEKIMILRQGRELNIEAPFGSSRRDLDKALRDLQESPVGLSTDAAMQQALDEIQRTWNQSRDSTSTGERGPTTIPGSEITGALQSGTSSASPRDVTGSSGAMGGGLVPRSCDIFESRVDAILNSWIQQRSQYISVTLASLADSATYLAGLPGNKSLLYLSDALETMPGLALSTYADTICPGGQQDRAMQALGEELGNAFVALSRHAAANRVTIYTLQGGGLQVSSTGGARDSGARSGSVASFEASRRAGNESGLILLAEQTGGRASLNSSDYSAALRELGTDMLSFYSLAYQPPAGAAGSEHEIEVRMRDSGREARYRRGYVDKNADQRFSEKLQGALFLGLVDNPLEARLGAGDFRAGTEGLTVMPLQVILPVELVSFVPEGDQLMGSILVRVLSRDLATGESGQTDRPFKVKHDPKSAGEWMQLPVELEFPPGSHAVAIGVLDQESGMISLVSTTIEVPAT